MIGSSPCARDYSTDVREAVRTRKTKQDLTLIAGSVTSARTYSVRQAAELVGVSPDTMRRWADSGNEVTMLQCGDTSFPRHR